MKKTVLLTIALVLVGTSPGTAATIEQQCWKKVTNKLTLYGCTFGNDLSEVSNICENKRRRFYNRCVKLAYMKEKIGPVRQVDVGQPVLRLAD